VKGVHQRTETVNLSRDDFFTPPSGENVRQVGATVEALPVAGKMIQTTATLYAMILTEKGKQTLHYIKLNASTTVPLSGCVLYRQLTDDSKPSGFTYKLVGFHFATKPADK
jgi:hypothetical protein